MNETTLEPIEEEISANRAEIKALFIPILRGGLWSFIPIYITYYLFNQWGQVFPRILWTAPIVLPPLIWLQGAIEVFLFPVKYVFTEKSLEERSSHRKKVKWHNVRKWWVMHEGEWIYVVFVTGALSKTRFRFHKSRGEEYIVRLIKQYGKI